MTSFLWKANFGSCATFKKLSPFKTTHVHLPIIDEYYNKAVKGWIRFFQCFAGAKTSSKISYHI